MFDVVLEFVHHYVILIHTNLCIYIYIYIYSERERERERDTHIVL